MNLTSPKDSRVLIESVIETLQQGETLLAGISDETYTRKVPIAFNASQPMRRNEMEGFRKQIKEEKLTKPVHVVEGGESRQESVANALAALGRSFASPAS